MNHTPKTLTATALLGGRALGGALKLEVALGLRACTAEAIAADLYEFDGRPGDPQATPPVAPIDGKQPLYNLARANHAEARANLRAVEQAARTFVAQAIDALKVLLGRRWNPQWNTVGFTHGSLALPRNPLPLLTALEAQYRTYPERAVPSLTLTAAKAGEMHRSLLQAIAAADAARVKEGEAKQARDLAWKRLRARIRLLREELTAILSPDDLRWHTFGFRRPVDGQTPDEVEMVEVQPAGERQAAVAWSRARLADHYRVAWKPTGSAGEPIELGLFTDREVLLRELPSGVSVTVFVSPRNQAGERRPTLATFVLPGAEPFAALAAPSESRGRG